MNIGISYNRFSDDRQTSGMSLERQRESLARYLAANPKIKIDKMLGFEDKAKSGTGQHLKAGFGSVLELVKKGKVGKGDHLFIESHSRMSRQTSDQAWATFGQIIRAGVSIHFTGSNKVYSGIESLQGVQAILPVLEMIQSNEYVNNLRQQSSNGTYKKIEKYIEDLAAIEAAGKSTRYEDHGMCIGNVGGRTAKHIKRGNDGRYELVYRDQFRLILDRIIAGETPASVILEQQKAGIDKQLPYYFGNATGLYNWLKSPQLYGFKAVKKEWIGTGIDSIDQDVECVPALITHKEWLQLQARKTTKARNHAQIINLVTGLGITHCGYCGLHIKSRNTTKRAFERGHFLPSDRRLVCHCEGITRYYDKKDMCGFTAINTDAVEKAIIESMKTEMVQADILSQNKSKADAELRDMQNELTSLENEITQLEYKLENLHELSERMLMRFDKQLNKAENRRDELKRFMMAIEPSSEQLQEMKAALTKWDKLSLRALDPNNVAARKKAVNLMAQTFSGIVITPNFMDKKTAVFLKTKNDKEIALLVWSKRGQPSCWTRYNVCD